VGAVLARWPSILVGFAVLAAAPELLAQETELPLTLDWAAPPGCSSREQILREVASMLVGTAAPVKALAVRATAERMAGGRWSVSLIAEGQGEPGRRRFEAESCQAAADATALIVALLIDPSRAPGALQAPGPGAPTAGGGEAPGVPAGLPGETPPGRGEPPPFAEKRVAPATPPAPAPSPVAPPTRSLPGILAARIAVGGDTGTISSANVGGEVAVSATVRRVRFEVAGSYWAPHTARLASNGQEGAKLGQQTLGLRIAYVARYRQLALAPFVGAELDWVSAAGFGGTQHGNQSAHLVGVDFGGTAAWWVWRRLALSLTLEGVVLASRPSFVATTGGAPTGTVQQASAVVGRTFLGIEVLFF
jgi:hypothetical protein